MNYYLSQGRQAFIQGLSVEDCPYPEGSLAESYWWGGYLIARDQHNIRKKA